MNEQSVDHNTRYQSLSALADGEATASEVTEACANWRDDDGARQVWASYQLIGDVLRSEELASTAQHDHFLSKLRQRLADEPVVLAPRAAAQVAAAAQPSAAPMTPARSRRWSGPLAVAASFVAIFALNVPFPFIVATAAVLGFLGGRLYPTKFNGSAGHTSAKKSYGAALIDDNTPTPEHARFSKVHLAKVVVAGALLWLVPMGLLTLSLGWQNTFTQMGWFFTKAALLTFGGAYAVLPYVYQGAVGHYGWLTPTQMIDGLALGETTPGPLIMVVAFVGFVGAYVQAAFGPENAFIAGALAAALVTWFTFLPSFLFILAGGPLVESTHDDLKFTAPLLAITAAVVGVVVNLAVFFAYHVLWPEGLEGHFDWAALAITLGAVTALFYFKWSVMQVLGTCAALGLVLSFVTA